jgi:pyruvate carboxylase subunit B
MRYRVSGDGWQRTFVAHSGPLGREWRITDSDGEEWSFRLRELEEGVFRFEVGDETHTLTVLPGNRPGEPVRFLLDDHPVELLVQDEIDLLQEVLGDAGGKGGRREVRSVMPGIIRAILVELDGTVEVDQPLLLLEAMKMENEIRAPAAGKVVRLAVKPGDTVAAGALLAVIEQ